MKLASMFLAIVISVFGLVAHAKMINGSIMNQGDTVHLEFLGEMNWVYDVQKVETKKGPEVQVAINPIDESTIKNLTSFKSDMVKAIEVDKNGADGKYVLKFLLANSDIESFDYLTDQPSRLIVDFYLSNAAAAKKAAAATKESVGTADKPAPKIATKLPEKKKNAIASDAEAKRNPASDVLVLKESENPNAGIDTNSQLAHSGIFDGGDPGYDRFSIKDYEIKEEAILKSKENYYIAFPMLKTPGEEWEKIKNAPAVYQIVPKDTEENKQARLLQTLFDKKRYAVFLKTYAWFKDKFPNSEYNEIVDYMKADVLLSMWEEHGRANDFEKALFDYKTIVKKYPESPLAERTSLKLGYLSLEKGDALEAIRLFNEHIEHYEKKDTISKDLANIGSGMAYAKLNKVDEAIAAFDKVEKSTKNQNLKMEAAFRRGDALVQAKKYSQAIEEYKKSLKKYPEAQKEFPNAYYNQAEALFGLDKFRESLDVYRDFVTKFPTNEQAPFAMTRLGELLEILGADKSRVMGAFLETYFRYGENPSAVVARMRLISGRMKGMRAKEVDNATKEISELSKKIDLPNIEQFATVMIADGYTRRGDYQKSNDILTKYYQQNPTTVDAKLVSKRIVANISDKIRSEVENGQFIQSLKTHQKYEDNWLKNSDRLDIKYDLGRSFEMAGVNKEADKYYRDVLNKIYSLKGTEAGKQAAAVQKLPSEDELNLRLAIVMYNEQKNGPSYDYLKNVKKPELLPEAQQIERVNLAVKLLEKRGDTDSAIRYLTELMRTWKGQPSLIADPYLKLSELETRQNRTDDAINSLTRIDELMTDSGKVSVDTHAKALENIAELYLKKNQTDKAITYFQKLLSQYEDKKPLASLRYKLGEIYFKRGEVQKAADTWSEFKGDKSLFWKNLAQEQLKNSEWRDDYKKYIKRIPAMSESK